MQDAGNYGIEDGWPHDPADMGDDPADVEFTHRYFMLKAEADRHPTDAYGDLCRAKIAAMSTPEPVGA